MKNIVKKGTDYLIISPKYSENVNNMLKYSVGNVLIISDDYYEIDELIEYINSGKIKKLILVDFIDIYRKIVPQIKRGTIVNWIFSFSFARLTDSNIYPIYKAIMEYYDRDYVTTIFCVDKSTFEVMKKAKIRVENIVLDIENTKVENNMKIQDSIGILGNDYNVFSGFYNALTAVKLLEKYFVKLISHMSETLEFLNFFQIKNQLCDKERDVILNNRVNIHLNFADVDIEWFLLSMDNEVPCILGNTSLLDNFPKLKQFLVMNSDDDVNELANRIESAINNRIAIQREYKKFRKKYREESKKNIAELLGGKQ